MRLVALKGRVTETPSPPSPHPIFLSFLRLSLLPPISLSPPLHVWEEWVMPDMYYSANKSTELIFRLKPLWQSLVHILCCLAFRVWLLTHCLRRWHLSGFGGKELLPYFIYFYMCWMIFSTVLWPRRRHTGSRWQYQKRRAIWQWDPKMVALPIYWLSYVWCNKNSVHMWNGEDLGGWR